MTTTTEAHAPRLRKPRTFP